jgi:hypothetical protein
LSLLTFNEFYFLLPTLVSLSFLWVFFFVNNTASIVTTQTNLNVKLNQINIKNIKIYIRLYECIIFLILVSFISFFGRTSLCIFNHLLLTNTNFKIILVFTVINWLLGKQLYLLYLTSVKITHEYVFILVNLTTLLPYIFCVNTIFFFFFYLEFLSCILFYKLISTKHWYNTYLGLKTNFKKNKPQNFISMVFFQY